MEDVRTAAVTGRLDQLVNHLATVQAGFYFKQVQVQGQTRVRFHDRIKVDDSTYVRVEGTFDPARYEANSPRTNLSGRQNVYVVGFVRSFQGDERTLELRPLLIGFPYFAPVGQAVDPQSAFDRAEVHPVLVEQFGLKDEDLGRTATTSELNRLFAMPEERVKQAFATILGVPWVPKDWGGEASDLVADVTVRGQPGRCAFAFKGPGGRPQAWTLYPNAMGKRGDQGIRLFTEPADIYTVQHCGRIAESVRHLMEALAVKHHKRFMLIDGHNTVRILRRAQLLD